MERAVTRAYCCVCDERVEVRELFSKMGGAPVPRLYGVVSCAACGLQFATPAPSVADLAEHYRASFARAYGNYVRAEAVKLEHFARKLDEISEHARPPGSLLDVGCANGYLLQVASDRGWQVRGVEINPAVAELLPEPLRAFVHFGTLDDYPGDRRFDLITMFDVLEHVPNPRATLVRCIELLAPGGAIAIQLPCVDSAQARLLGRRWYHYGPPSHLTFFSLPTISSLLADLDLEVVRSGWTRKTFSLEYLWRQLSSVYASGFAKELRFGRIGQLPFPVPMSERLIVARRA